jgi:hypothetical protein
MILQSQILSLPLIDGALNIQEGMDQNLSAWMLVPEE